ncbi:MAG: effector-associated constant component EACC1 [Pseudonocardiaceae bacterium]
MVVDVKPDVESDELDRAVRRLRAELRELDIESVAPVTPEAAPPGAKGVACSVGALLITLTTTPGVCAVALEIARDWLARHAGAHRIQVTIDGDPIMLERGSAAERSALIDAYLRRHGVP